MSNDKQIFHHGPSILVHVHYDVKGIQKVILGEKCEGGLEINFFSNKKNLSIEQLIIDWFSEYSEGGNSSILLPFDFTNVSPFTYEVLKALQNIPFGQTLSYQELGGVVSSQKAARAVGGACGRNPFPLFIPCHRVILSTHKLGGFSAGSGPSLKYLLLKYEKFII